MAAEELFLASTNKAILDSILPPLRWLRISINHLNLESRRGDDWILSFALRGAHFGGNPNQVLYSGIKVPLLLSIATLNCLPNFYVLNIVLKLDDDFAAALKGIIATQAVFAILLVSFSPNEKTPAQVLGQTSCSLVGPRLIRCC